MGPLNDRIALQIGRLVIQGESLAMELEATRKLVTELSSVKEELDTLLKKQASKKSKSKTKKKHV